MKIFLVKTPYLYLCRSVSENAYPLGLAYIASMLCSAGFDVEMLDPENQKLDLVAFKKKIQKDKADIVGISCTTANFDMAREFAKMAKETGAKTIIGGVHATVRAMQIIKNNKEFDFVIFGEAEQTIVELCQTIRDGKQRFDSILGLAYRENDKVNINEKRPFLEDLDQLPPPQWDLLDLGVYTLPDFIYSGKRGITLVTARGCPAKCIYCSVAGMNGRKFRHFSAERIVNDIQILINKHNREFIAFRDDTFTISRQRVVDICNLLLKKNIKIRWYCLARANTVNQELLFLMKKAGCDRIAYGVESGDQRILNILKKGISLQQVRNAFAWSRNAGIKPVGSFIFGSPGETQETMDKTLDFALELDPDIAHFFVMTPTPGTELWEKYKNIYFDEGIETKNSSLGIYSMQKESTFHCGDLTYNDLKRQLVKANRRFYFRLHYIMKKIKQLKKYDDIKVMIHHGIALAKSMIILNPH